MFEYRKYNNLPDKPNKFSNKIVLTGNLNLEKK